MTESECTESEKGVAGHDFDDMWELFGSFGSQRWSESKDAQMDDFNTNMFSFINSTQEGSSDEQGGGGTALTEVRMPSGQENILEADKRRQRMEAKLDDLIHAFLEKGHEYIDWVPKISA